MRKKYSKYNENAVLVSSEVVEIEEYNKEIQDKIKNVFYCSSAKGKPRMCVYWQRTNIQVGDKVEMKGRFKENGIFLVWSLQFTRNA